MSLLPTPPQPSLLTAERFDQALMHLRKSQAPEVGLWRGLLSALKLNETDVAAALLRWHGIAVISDDVWPKVRLLETEPVNGDFSRGVVRITAGENCFLLCEDPWSPKPPMP